MKHYEEKTIQKFQENKKLYNLKKHHQSFKYFDELMGVIMI